MPSIRYRDFIWYRYHVESYSHKILKTEHLPRFINNLIITLFFPGHRHHSGIRNTSPERPRRNPPTKILRQKDNPTKKRSLHIQRGWILQNIKIKSNGWNRKYTKGCSKKKWFRDWRTFAKCRCVKSCQLLGLASKLLARSRTDRFE